MCQIKFFGTMEKTNYSGTAQTSIPTTLGGIDVNDSTSTASLANSQMYVGLIEYLHIQKFKNCTTAEKSKTEEHLHTVTWFTGGNGRPH